MKRISSSKKIKRVKKLKRLERARFRRRHNLEYRFYLSQERLTSARLKYRQQISIVGCKEFAERNVPRHGIRRVFDFPEKMNFKDELEDTMCMLLKLRELESVKYRRRKFYLEFEKIKAISPGALLVLAAELDSLYRRWGQRRRKPITADSDRWNTGLAALFSDFGIFDLLNAKPVAEFTYGDELRAVKFRCGETQDGSVADQLIRDIVHVSDKAPAERARLYEGLGEALANTLDHAYPNPYVSYPATRLSAWWAGAIYDEARNITHFMVYDRGIGLPASLPEQHYEWFEQIYRSIKGSKNEDAELIWAAIKSPSSGTKLIHRGEGLKQMAEVVDSHPGSELKILSGQGSVIYNGNGKKILNHLKAPFLGTLVEWQINHG